MVKSSFDLDCGTSTLNFKTEENGWCRVELHHRGDVVALGADGEKIIIERLLDGIKKESLEKQSERDGIPVDWVLTLCENHYVLLIGIVGNDRHLFIGKSGKILSKMILTSEIRKKWIQILSKKL